MEVTSHVLSQISAHVRTSLRKFSQSFQLSCRGRCHPGADSMTEVEAKPETLEPCPSIRTPCLAFCMSVSSQYNAHEASKMRLALSTRRRPNSPFHASGASSGVGPKLGMGKDGCDSVMLEDV